MAEDIQTIPKRFGQTLTPREIETKTIIQTAVEQELPHCENVTDLATRLVQHQIHMHFQRRKQKGKDGAITGLTFERNGQFMRGSLLGKQYSAGALMDRLKN